MEYAMLFFAVAGAGLCGGGIACTNTWQGTFKSLPTSCTTMPWAQGRRFGLMGSTTMSLKDISWKVLTTDLCNTDFSQNSAAGLTSNMMQSATGMNGLTCSGWDACKTASSTRCMQYRNFMTFGLVIMGIFVGAASCSLIGIVLYCLEPKVKKKKGPQFNQLVRCTAAFSLSALVGVAGIIMFLVVWGSILHELGSNQYYPTPMLYIGFYVAIIGVIFLCICALMSIFRLLACLKKPEKKAAGGDWGEAYDPYADPYAAGSYDYGKHY